MPPASHWTPPAAQAERAKGEDEPLRLVLGLNDWFSSIGLGALVCGGLFAGISTYYTIMISLTETRNGTSFGPAAVREYSSSLYLWLPVVIPMVVVWIASEFFVRRRRMALTALTAANSVALLCIAGVALYIFQYVQYQIPEMSPFGKRETPMELSWFSLFVPWVIAAIVNWTFWRVNRVPVAFAWGCAMLLPLFFSDMVMDSRAAGHAFDGESFQLRVLIFGLIAFAGAMIWDRSDPLRETQRSDTGFWMHLLAALCLVPVLFAYTAEFGLPTLGFITFALIIIVAPMIDRRVAIVVAMPFILAGDIISGLDLGLVGSLVMFLLMIALSVFWDRIRTTIGLRRVGEVRI